MWKKKISAPLALTLMIPTLLGGNITHAKHIKNTQLTYSYGDGDKYTYQNPPANSLNTTTENTSSHIPLVIGSLSFLALAAVACTTGYFAYNIEKEDSTYVELHKKNEALKNAIQKSPTNDIADVGQQGQPDTNFPEEVRSLKQKIESLPSGVRKRKLQLDVDETVSKLVLKYDADKKKHIQNIADRVTEIHKCLSPEGKDEIIKQEEIQKILDDQVKEEKAKIANKGNLDTEIENTKKEREKKRAELTEVEKGLQTIKDSPTTEDISKQASVLQVLSAEDANVHTTEITEITQLQEKVAELKAQAGPIIGAAQRRKELISLLDRLIVDSAAKSGMFQPKELKFGVFGRQTELKAIKSELENATTTNMLQKELEAIKTLDEIIAGQPTPQKLTSGRSLTGQHFIATHAGEVPIFIQTKAPSSSDVKVISVDIADIADEARKCGFHVEGFSFLSGKSTVLYGKDLNGTSGILKLEGVKTLDVDQTRYDELNRWFKLGAAKRVELVLPVYSAQKVGPKSSKNVITRSAYESSAQFKDAIMAEFGEFGVYGIADQDGQVIVKVSGQIQETVPNDPVESFTPDAGDRVGRQLIELIYKLRIERMRWPDVKSANYGLSVTNGVTVFDYAAFVSSGMTGGGQMTPGHEGPNDVGKNQKDINIAQRRQHLEANGKLPKTTIDQDVDSTIQIGICFLEQFFGHPGDHLASYELFGCPESWTNEHIDSVSSTINQSPFGKKDQLKDILYSGRLIALKLGGKTKSNDIKAIIEPLRREAIYPDGPTIQDVLDRPGGCWALAFSLMSWNCPVEPVAVMELLSSTAKYQQMVKENKSLLLSPYVAKA